MNASKDKELEVLYDHYKEACGVLASNLRIRIRLVLAVLIVLTLMVFQGTDPDNANTLASAWLGSQATGDTSLKVILDPRFISLLLWFALSSLTVQMFQKSLLIEKQASYARDVEASLDELIGSSKIGHMRLKRPDYFRYSNYLYFWGFLLMITVVSLGKLWLEVSSLELHSRDLVTSGVFALLDIWMAAIIVFYSYRFCIDFRSITVQSQSSQVGSRAARRDGNVSERRELPAHNPGPQADG